MLTQHFVNIYWTNSILCDMFIYKNHNAALSSVPTHNLSASCQIGGGVFYKTVCSHLPVIGLEYFVNY